MKLQHYTQLRELFDEAVELDPEQRVRFVDEIAQNDSSLATDLQRMLEADDTGGFVRAPDSMPERIGNYTILDILGIGGMGIVYRARQRQPQRDVALKVMRSSLVSGDALRRFELESQVLARLRHPNIGQVYDAGTHDDGSGGVPYFAMEYLADTQFITAYARSRDLDMRRRLELFAKVCDAVHHGHQKGVIHRDLKPSNILVGVDGEPKIIDFGVARATGSGMAFTTLRTDVGQLVGTLQYMSPEQCGTDPSDLDTRGDVYSLGMVLYELLADRLPYDLSRVALHDATRVIRETAPEPLGSIRRTLRGDVETICRKALHKDRDARYLSADALADDVRRYLDRRPILARRDSVWYVVRKAGRRRWKELSAVAVVALLIAVSGILWVHAGRTAEDARLAALSSLLAAAPNPLDHEQLRLYADYVRRARAAESDNQEHELFLGRLITYDLSVGPIEAGDKDVPVYREIQTYLASVGLAERGRNGESTIQIHERLNFRVDGEIFAEEEEWWLLPEVGQRSEVRLDPSSIGMPDRARTCTVTIESTISYCWEQDLVSAFWTERREANSTVLLLPALPQRFPLRLDSPDLVASLQRDTHRTIKIIERHIDLARKYGDALESAHYEDSHDASAGFSATDNPNGVWSYGYLMSHDSPLILFDHADSDLSGQAGWSMSTIRVSWPPTVVHESSNQSIPIASHQIRAGALQLHPGRNNERCVVRWAAASSLLVDVAATFTRIKIYNMDLTCDVHVLLNSISVFDAVLSGERPTVSCRRRFAVMPGDTIDFVVGYGGDGYIEDATQLEALVRTAPADSG